MNLKDDYSGRKNGKDKNRIVYKKGILLRFQGALRDKTASRESTKWVRFFTKKQMRIFNPKTDTLYFDGFFNRIQNGLLIQMIHNGGGFFGSYPKPNTLDTWSEAFLYYGSEKSEYCQR